MNKIIHLEDNDLYLSKRYLKQFISIKALEKWNNILDVINIKTEDGIFYLYNSIPRRTRKKLPPADKIISQENKKDSLQKITESIKSAKYFEHTKYKSFYETDSTLSPEQITRFSQLHAVFQCIIDLKINEGVRDLKNIYDVFNGFYPGKYSSKHALSNAIRKAMSVSIMHVALDKRVFGNNNEQTNTKLNPTTKYWMANLTAHPRKFSNTKILELISIACDEKQFAKPSLSWVKKHRLRLLKNVDVHDSRYGQQETNKKMPFASLKTAEYANDQHQMDGWTPPYWYKEDNKLKRCVVVYLIDNNSKKIVGYSIGKSEDSALIMDAIRDAVNNTGVLPFEILTDNHSFNQTKESHNLKSLLTKKGTRYIITQNPQYKSIIERRNQYLDSLCKNYYGYLGKGVRSKSKDALPKPEMIDSYVKYVLSVEEIKGNLIAVIESYNKAINKNGKSPNDLYVENANPHPIEVNIFDRAELLTMQTEKLIRRGQITFVKGITKYEFQLPADLFMQYNDMTVIVKYEDLREGIYLFHKRTGEAITFLHPKGKINGAKNNQTDADILALNKHSGRIKGIKSKASKQLEDLTEKALSIDPDAYAIINRLTTPKNIVTELQQDSDLRNTAEAKIAVT